MGLEGYVDDDLDFKDFDDLDDLAEEQEIVYDEIKNQTEKAILFKFGNKEVWLPKSQLKMKPGSKIVIIPNWLCYEKELI